jgi:hypothetical protein
VVDLDLEGVLMMRSKAELLRWLQARPTSLARSVRLTRPHDRVLGPRVTQDAVARDTRRPSAIRAIRPAAKRLSRMPIRGGTAERREASLTAA